MTFLFGVLFFVFTVYAFLLSPNQDKQILGQLLQINNNLDLSLKCVFWAMGLVPILLGLYLIPTRHKYKLNLWPFWLASFLVGAGAILPYLTLRKPQVNSISLSKWEKLLKNDFLRLIFLLAIWVLVIYGFIQGNPDAYIKAARESRLVNVMSLDFVILMLIVWPYLALQDLKRV